MPSGSAENSDDSGTKREDSTMGVRIKSLLGLTAAGLFASVLIPTAAHADSVTFIFCNASSSDEYVSFPYHGGFSSYVESPGNCWRGVLSGVDNDEAVGYRLVNGQWLAVVTKYFSDSTSGDPSHGVELDF
jgi:hypothetical protein